MGASGRRLGVPWGVLAASWVVLAVFWAILAVFWGVKAVCSLVVSMISLIFRNFWRQKTYRNDRDGFKMVGRASEHARAASDASGALEMYPDVDRLSTFPLSGFGRFPGKNYSNNVPSYSRKFPL